MVILALSPEIPDMAWKTALTFARSWKYICPFSRIINYRYNKFRFIIPAV